MHDHWNLTSPDRCTFDVRQNSRKPRCDNILPPCPSSRRTRGQLQCLPWPLICHTRAPTETCSRRIYVYVYCSYGTSTTHEYPIIIIFFFFVSKQGFANVRHRRLLLHLAHSPVDRVHYGHSFGILPAVRRKKLPVEERKRQPTIPHNNIHERRVLAKKYFVCRYFARALPPGIRIRNVVTKKNQLDVHNKSHFTVENNPPGGFLDSRCITYV